MDVRPGYKQTDVGMIPKDWRLVRVGEIATTVASGRSHVDSEFGDYPVYGSTGIIGRCRSSAYFGKAVLIARVGANAGKLAVVDGEYGVTDNTIIMRISDSYQVNYVSRQLEAKRLNSIAFGSGQPLNNGDTNQGTFNPPPINKRRTRSHCRDVERCGCSHRIP
jgi:type I restriction enzyme, S subunit